MAGFGDDVLICSVKKGIEKYFRITDLGSRTHFLGVKITSIGTGTQALTQKPLVEKILGEANMMEYKPRYSPLHTSHIQYEKRIPLTTEEREEMKSVPYSIDSGSLIHLRTRTRADLSTAVPILGKF